MNETDDDQTNELLVAVYDQYPAFEMLERARLAYQRLLAAT